MSEGPVMVIGGGLSGLATAWNLQQAGHQVRLLEASGRTGGSVHTHRHGGSVLEAGAIGVGGPAPAFHRLSESLGLSDHLVRAPAEASERHIYWNGRLQPLPSSGKAFIRSPLFTWDQKLRALAEPLVVSKRIRRSEHDVPMAEFFGRRLGRGISSMWVDTLAAEIYAGHPNRLGIQSAFPRLHARIREAGSVVRAFLRRPDDDSSTYEGQVAGPAAFSASGAAEAAATPPAPSGFRFTSFAQGLEQLPLALREALGDSVSIGTKVHRIRLDQDGSYLVNASGPEGDSLSFSATALVLATPVREAALLLAELAPESADLLSEIEAVSLVVTQALFPREALPGLPTGRSFYAPRHSRMRTLGWTFTSRLFPEHVAEEGIIMHGTVGGALDPRASLMSDEALRHLMLGELALALGQRRLPKPTWIHFSRWHEALPQYAVGHARRVAAADGLLRGTHPCVHLAGNYLGGVHVEACLERAAHVAEAMSRSLAMEGPRS